VLLGRHVPECAGGPRSAEGDRPRDARDRSTGPTPAVVDDQRLQGDCGGEVRPGQRPIRSGGGHPRDHRRILPATPGTFAARRGTPTRQPRHVAHLEGWIGLAAPRSRSVVGARRTSRKPASGLRVWDSVRVPRWTPRAARGVEMGEFRRRRDDSRTRRRAWVGLWTRDRGITDARWFPFPVAVRTTRSHRTFQIGECRRSQPTGAALAGRRLTGRPGCGASGGARNHGLRGITGARIREACLRLCSTVLVATVPDSGILSPSFSVVLGCGS